MADFRSKSCRDVTARSQNIEIEYGGGGGGGRGGNTISMHDLRPFSVNYAFSGQPNTVVRKEVDEIKKRKSNENKYSRSWSLIDPELQRKKRVAGYKVYAMEGKMKGSFRKSMRWIRNTCNQVVYGLW